MAPVSLIALVVSLSPQAYHDDIPRRPVRRRHEVRRFVQPAPQTQTIFVCFVFYVCSGAFVFCVDLYVLCFDVRQAKLHCGAAPSSVIVLFYFQEGRF